MNIISKLLGLILIVSGTILASQYYENSYKKSKLELLWRKDISRLQKNKQLPKQWSKIKQISYTAHTKQAALWLNEIQVPIRINHNGQYRLEIALDNWSSGKDYGVVIQYSIIDIASKNIVAELGRTFQFNKKSKPYFKRGASSFAK